MYKNSPVVAHLVERLLGDWLTNSEPGIIRESRE